MKQIIVIGNGMVGYKFCEKLRKNAPADQIKLIVYGEEMLPAYDRVHLSEYFDKQDAEKLLMAPREWYQEQDIELRTGEMITAIDRHHRQVITHKGEKESYDYLVLATGSSAMVPKIKGVEKKGVFVYRKIEDLDQIIDYGSKVKRAAVLGGGLLGLEAAKALLDMRLTTQVVEFAPRLMPRQLDNPGADLLKEKIERLGVEVLLDKQTVEIEGNGSLSKLLFADGTSLDTDMLVISCGIIPRDELATTTDLTTGKRGGFVVNHNMQTDDPYIYAIGEAASFEGQVFGLVAPGYEMAEVAINHLLQKEGKVFSGADMSTKLKLIGVDVASFGDAIGNEPHVPIVYQDGHAGIYKRINLSPDGKKLLGGIMVGDVGDYNMLHQMTLQAMSLPPHPEDLILGARNGASTEGGGCCGTACRKSSVFL